MAVTLPSLPAGNTEAFKPVAKYSPATRRPIEPVGRYFLAHATRTLRGHTWSEFEKLEAERNVKQVEEDQDQDIGDEEQDAELLAIDPREWKTADLYAVLGLSKLRFRANEDQIRRAHRKQVLKHHPDKKSAAGGLEQDGFFKIIQKAFEIMLDPSKRLQYDSVDENADVKPPAPKSKYDFFEAFGPVFESEARFSKKQPVPLLGTLESTKEEVDAFYNFWGKFDSWKTFEFKDEDVPDDTANRDHKRYIERKNIATRKKFKQEDNKRVIDLVERAYSEDPRIKLFKDTAKKEKERKKWEREAGSRQAAEEAAAKKAAEEEAAKKAAEDAAASKVSSKKAKEAAKAAKKKQKRSIRSAPKDAEYFGDAGKATDIDADVEYLIDKFDDVQLSSLTTKVTGASADTVKSAFNEVIAELVGAGKAEGAYLKYFSA
ncbi:DEHA2G18480p [Debaryomyces hansenii CBS767]|uniref:DEHA2G18480p n=1 Tax=Debaryomyces hansenii (strain ATCC 36239 / CBS 767 / BCRC 21394 / JCM 1990 / NBRC 0083 / IGC 2968) TaxID=284592 RepID=Q6BHH7_DEBHA|nr:DEHA2G18480p [Debaryomyces hansenii CBS767]CAG90850.1 DEHA2G18480p [Debaryomyces hansenii CBS767]|eukprot:XP_462344.1 DEHA2G18480p [Debaryomyces hansenii CBS767]